ncbi:uncharacterized protein SPPG_05913 [Spizellomyces punctatus DAOM BR117]|uniref:Uncharacterized protein n=1 Tax=Spizellomyces punctatus (strain DAOM BR117) TaxID=645134 RepID=A0A0L0HDA3_SPIPD|nr:uncharacterized protein SPPG_05913 [Spizellomyces punctatus DAOM BR117]KNC98954.1 hypothetical protein SPPG_05913 [Spizellomyces punctatus DAOM BR117]|eukprot:XP_016606994.1 hypothetical protein SPPG_05913 [Spizellomyces punctatus DAOM BR117]
MPPKPLRISKQDISNPTPLLSAEQAQAAAAMGDVLKHPTHHFQRRDGGDSGISLDEKRAHMGQHAIAPFSAGRFDSSASVAGGPNDPRVIKARLPPPRLTMRQYQSFVQALAVYRRQVQALAAASETFVRALEDLAEFVPAAHIRRPHVVGDLDFLIDSTHLIANAHQIWAESLEREFEAPLTQNIQNIMTRVTSRQNENKDQINKLVERLHQEEDKSYKLGKKKQRDIKALQSSLNVRMSIADEIKRLTVENQTLHDTLSHHNMEFILENCASGVRGELQNYETIYEGLKKLGAYSDSSDFPHNYQTQRAGRFSIMSQTPTIPQTDILPPSERFPDMTGDDRLWEGDEDRFDVELLRNALKNLGGD